MMVVILTPVDGIIRWLPRGFSCSRCVSQDKGNAMQSQLNNQQRQINELSVRLQSAESRLSKQEEKLRNELLQSSGYCYLNGARYSTGTVLYGRICQNQSGSASWQVYSRR